jgi:cytochrome c-type biogenesis protein
MDPGEIVRQGGLWAAMPIALAAGLLSFLSPCVLPLVPGYLGYVGGVAGGAVWSRRRTVLGVALFIVGFSVVFLGIFIAGGAVGIFFLRYEELILRLAGIVVIVMGLVFVGQVSLLQRTITPRWRPATGLVGAPLLGVTFAVGWTPCIGPTLIAVQSLVLDSHDLGRAALIGAAYCLGLGVPFLLVALGFGWVGGSIARVKRRIRVVNIVGGALLVVIGVLMVTGVWRLLLSELGAVILGVEPAL